MTDASPGELLPGDGRVSVPAHRAQGSAGICLGQGAFAGVLFNFGLFASALLPDDLLFWQQWQQVYLL